MAIKIFRSPGDSFPYSSESRLMQRRTLLLIEDDFDAREAYGLALRHFGYRVIEAVNGIEGLRLAREVRPDLILMDLGLPQLDGWQATEMLKRDPETAHIPVMAVTVHVHDSERARAEVVGCDRFVPKPCVPSQLRDEIERLLGPPGSEGEKASLNWAQSGQSESLDAPLGATTPCASPPQR
jgi:two-component system, cell cycle response regulator DivK